MPFVVALSVPFGDLHDGISVLDTDGITQAANSASAALKVAELTVTLQFDGVPYNMVADVGSINVGALLQKINGLLITDRISLCYIHFLVHIKIKIFLPIIFPFIQCHPGRKLHFILFRCQGPHGITSVFHSFLQPGKLYFG